MRRLALLITVLAFAGAVTRDVLTGEVHYFPGYAATIGLFGCIAIIVVSKWLGTVLLQRREDYYPNDIPADDQEDLRG
ncbi:MAG: hypothetical protein WD011_06900 [Nitriliruptoraceae bacterium]